jgi:AAA family ATP:ADP antiporter
MSSTESTPVRPSLVSDLERRLDRLLGLREQDHRNALIGFATLLLAMAAHGVLETARDTLFLSTLSPKLLPWAYLGIATLTLGLAEFHRRVLSRLSHRRTLSLTLLGGAVVTASFALLGSSLSSTAVLLGLYIWTGLLATTVVVQFWLLAGDVMDFGQAKRAFSLIGAGGLAGAALGSVIASSVLLVASARALPVVSGALLATAAAVPRLFSARRFPRQDAPGVGQPSQTSPLVRLRSDPYLRRILMLALLGTLTLTVADFVFKSVIVREIPRERLGDFFGRYYAILNASALGVQLFLAPRVLRRSGIHRAVQIMPVMLLSAALGFAVVGALWTVLVLKATDGTLRHSVNRISAEILYLPLTDSLRERFRAFVEAVGLRIGQALASLLVLLAIAVDASTRSLGWLAAALAAAWLLTTFGLERLYVGRFRGELSKGTLKRRGRVPELDVRSLEALLTALSSDDDAEVITALDMFAAYDKTRLVSALVLYHPSPSVVLRALEVLSGPDRADVMRVVGRLLSHADQHVRAAALRLYVAGTPQIETLEKLARDESPEVRATALVGLIHGGAIDPEPGDAALAEVVSGPSPSAREALALALPLLPPATQGWLAVELAQRDEPGLGAVLARSIAAAPSAELVPALIPLLAEREARADARAALAQLGDSALDELERSLGDLATPAAIRRHVPRTISRFSGTRPVSMLERFLASERDETVSFKILRALGHLRRHRTSPP